jgi:hypothetical protein
MQDLATVRLVAQQCPSPAVPDGPAHNWRPLAPGGRDRGRIGSLAIAHSSSSVKMCSGLGERVEHGEEDGVAPVLHLLPREAGSEWWQRKELGGGAGSVEWMRWSSWCLVSFIGSWGSS